MSDHSNSNLHRSDGTSGRGLLVAFAIILAIIVIVAFVGSFSGGDGTGTTPGTTGENAITPPVDGTVSPVPDLAPVPAE